MKYHIDFSIFAPGMAFGNVTGQIELPASPKIGDVVVLFKDDASEFGPEFSGRLCVESITPVHSEVIVTEVIGLEDLELNSYEAAKKVANRLESECGLFCVEYQDPQDTNN